VVAVPGGMRLPVYQGGAVQCLLLLLLLLVGFNLLSLSLSCDCCCRWLRFWGGSLSCTAQSRLEPRKGTEGGARSKPEPLRSK
jgi:hypothetical protein